MVRTFVRVVRTNPPTHQDPRSNQAPIRRGAEHFGRASSKRSRNHEVDGQFTRRRRNEGGRPAITLRLAMVSLS